METVFTDDLTGDTLTPDDTQTVTFTVDGVSYEIDLSAKNAASLRNDFAAWTEHAHTVPGTTTTRRAARQPLTTAQRPKTVQRSTADREGSTRIREWAQSNGHTVSARGRIPATVVDAYNAAH
ncbi:Lsr2 family protein (plasmid) [Rhodococcus antarcticus]|uniref:Lsr2 family protein n=1 Tax=Rhodococcus antarcticus TaxID=2987751 RepID=A0ABY6P5T2_9NOCA|nr:Lsr2 family protein [Rhodococcus antarcticus]UZJ27029.1 Lsr2 family protein [Rhodococcus antarcticus]